MIKFLKILLTGFFVSFFIFPLSFNGLPVVFNTKNILAVLGFIIYVKDSFFSEFYFRKDFAIATLFAIFFSLLCLFSVYFNGTYEINSYTIYFRSFFIWFFSAKLIVSLIYWTHGKCNFVKITEYISYVSAIQCILAIIIDRNEAFKALVNSVIFQGQDFLDEVDRLYGIGASLDPAGVKFLICLIMIAFVLNNSSKQMKKMKILGLMICFTILASVGNMISRTTTIGLIFALLAFILGSGIPSLSIKRENLKMYKIVLPVIIIAICVGIYLYNTDDFFYSKFRFAFEGFFNWVENGEWTTGSTEKLNREMWIWPTNLTDWIVGTGKYDGFFYSTDIGYCRFILFCGLLGFIPFASFFIYNGINLIHIYHRYRYMFLTFIIVSFIIWIKVSTDIFFIYAIFYNFVDEDELQEQQKFYLQ